MIQKKLTPEEFIACLLLVKSTRAGWMMGRTGGVAWASREDMQAAFAMYNRAVRGLGKELGTGCAACHVKVFNWLLDVVTKDVQAQRLSGSEPVFTVYIAEPNV